MDWLGQLGPWMALELAGGVALALAVARVLWAGWWDPSLRRAMHPAYELPFRAFISTVRKVLDGEAAVVEVYHPQGWLEGVLRATLLRLDRREVSGRLTFWREGRGARFAEAVRSVAPQLASSRHPDFLELAVDIEAHLSGVTGAAERQERTEAKARPSVTILGLYRYLDYGPHVVVALGIAMGGASSVSAAAAVAVGQASLQVALLGGAEGLLVIAGSLVLAILLRIFQTAVPLQVRPQHIQELASVLETLWERMHAPAEYPRLTKVA